MEQNELNDKVAIVTGGGTGIGKAIVNNLVNQGVKLVIAGRRLQPLTDCQSAHPSQINYLQCDLAQSGEAARLHDFTLQQYGRLDILVNNAGVFLMKPLLETSDEDIQALNATNLNAILSMIRECIPSLTESNGHIVNISSVVGKAVMPGTALYSASKAAVNQLTRTLAAELGEKGIRVNAIAPGLTRTDMAEPVTSQADMVTMMESQTPLGRLGETDDIAKVMSALLSQDMDWVTGQIIDASGGFLL